MRDKASARKILTAAREVGSVQILSTGIILACYVVILKAET